MLPTLLQSWWENRLVTRSFIVGKQRTFYTIYKHFGKKNYRKYFPSSNIPTATEVAEILKVCNKFSTTFILNIQNNAIIYCCFLEHVLIVKCIKIAPVYFLLCLETFVVELIFLIYL